MPSRTLGKRAAVRGTRKIRPMRYAAKFLKRRIGIAGQTHIFKRLGKKTVIYVNTPNGITKDNSNDTGLILTSASSDNLSNCIQFGWSHTFRLKNCVASDDIKNLFDRYKIIGVKYRILFQNNSSSTVGTSVLPVIHYATDFDDSNNGSTVESVSVKSNCRMKVLGTSQTVTHYFKPKVQAQIFQGVTSAYAPREVEWINTDYDDVPHYGLKIWMNGVFAAAINACVFTVEPVYYLACKDVQ